MEVLIQGRRGGLSSLFVLQMSPQKSVLPKKRCESSVFDAINGVLNVKNLCSCLGGDGELESHVRCLMKCLFDSIFFLVSHLETMYHDENIVMNVSYFVRAMR